MDLITLGVLLAIAAVTGFVARALSGYSLAGCLVTYVAACVGAIGGWVLQQQLVGPDALVQLPIGGDIRTVSVIGATIGALLVGFIASLLSRPTQIRRRRR
jgi:uncharacterized membrane protein YeaQ/YmgE (transglycosylase-associated protein family)